MYTIDCDIVNEYIVNKSRFICKLIKVFDEKDIKQILLNTKNEYKNATHYCYAYIIDNKEKCSDDKEPQGSAGLPILNILKKNNLNFVLCIVIRYFGGIKLGKGGLTRAYSNSISNTLELIKINEIKKYYKIKIVIDYDKQKELDNILKNYNYDKIFSIKIIYNVDIPIDEYAIIEKKLKECPIIIENEFYN